MKKKIAIIVICICIILLGIIIINNKHKKIDNNVAKENAMNIEKNLQNTNQSLINDLEQNSSIKNSNIPSSEDESKIYIKVNDNILDVKLEDNSSAKALVEKLRNGDITINAHDYGNFEKVGSLGFNLPTNDTTITTEPGDLILYQGNQITLYYNTNTWNFTRLGKVKNVSQNELKNILGTGNITMVISVKK